MKNKAKIIKIILIILIVLIILIIPGLNNDLKVVNYTIDSDKIDAPVRIALITDLHSCAYGDHESELIDAVDGQHPDIVLLGGDIFDEKSNNENTSDFLHGISELYPTYYVTGNHEFWGGVDKYEAYMDVVEECGIIRLQGDVIPLHINGNYISLAGVDDFDCYLVDSDLILENQFVDAYLSLDADSYNIILAHRPDYFDTYEAQDYDLALCGHVHGGQWRIPGLINGIYAPDQGLFPKYAGGVYEEDTTTMIVSRGLARETTWVPRIYNPPELVIVDLVPSQS
ncbi:MAG: metallophosphoesterase [Clostridiales bacterium]|nr:metallophosphoesterase [Clostridiales bacterium]